MLPVKPLLLPLLLATLAACTTRSMDNPDVGFGANPELPAPQKSLLPTLHIAPAVGWVNGNTPTSAPGTVVTVFAQGLDHPRWLYTLPNGDVLVAETNAPPKPDDGKGIKGWVMRWVMGRAGAGGASANRIRLLRDADGDGHAELQVAFAEGLNSPFGMALVGNRFYVANTDAVLSFTYTPGQTRLTGPGQKLVELPAGRLNHHWTKNLIASADGRKLYVSVGSNSNIGENGPEAEVGRAAIWEVDTASGAHRVFADGLRNPNGMAWQPSTQRLWTVVNERDELGPDLVPDYLTSVQDGGFYGWPYSYFGPHVDVRVQPQKPALVAAALVPDYALGAHTAPLGLVDASGNRLPAAYTEGMFVGQHGSWNRKPRSGYKVIFVPFKNGQPNGAPLDILSGFVNADGDAQGRPVGVALDTHGALLVADDVGNCIWRVTADSSGKRMPSPEQMP